MAVSLWRLTFETGAVHRYLSPSHGYPFLCLWTCFIIYQYLQDLPEPHKMSNYIYIYIGFKTFLHYPTNRLHCFISPHWPSFRFLSFIAFLLLSIQFSFSLPRAVLCFDIHFSVILDNFLSAIL